MKILILLAVLYVSFAEVTTGDRVSTNFINFAKNVFKIIGITENYDDLTRCLRDDHEKLWNDLNNILHLRDLKTLEGASSAVLLLTTEILSITSGIIGCSKNIKKILNIMEKIAEIVRDRPRFEAKISQNLGRIGKEIGDYINAWNSKNGTECGIIAGNLIKWFYL